MLLAFSSLTFAFSVIKLAYIIVIIDCLKFACWQSLQKVTLTMDSPITELVWNCEKFNMEVQHLLLLLKSLFCDLIKDWFSFLFSLGLQAHYHFHFSTWSHTRPTVTSPIHLLCWFSVLKVYVCTLFSKFFVTYVFPGAGRYKQSICGQQVQCKVFIIVNIIIIIIINLQQQYVNHAIFIINPIIGAAP